MDRIEVGYVLRAHGLDGELRVALHDPQSTTLSRVTQVWIGGARYEIESAQGLHRAVLLKLVRVADRDASLALKGKTVEVARCDIPLEQGEFFLADLPGCEVLDQNGTRLGTIVQVLSGPQDLAVLHDEEAQVERMMPLRPELLIAVDTTGKRIIAAVPEGLPETQLRKRR